MVGASEIVGQFWQIEKEKYGDELGAFGEIVEMRLGCLLSTTRVAL